MMHGQLLQLLLAQLLSKTSTSTSDFDAQMLISSNFAITTHPTPPADTATVVAPLLTEESDYQLLVNAN